VENGEVHDEDDEVDSKIKIETKDRESQVSDSEVRDDEDEFAYSENQLKSFNKDESPY
jgi:hypothetical protein